MDISEVAKKAAVKCDAVVVEFGLVHVALTYRFALEIQQAVDEAEAAVEEISKVNDMLIAQKRKMEEQIDSLQAELEGREQGCYGKACSHYVLAKEYKQERDEAHAKLAHLERKLAHGCIDAYCPQCDGKE